MNKKNAKIQCNIVNKKLFKISNHLSKKNVLLQKDCIATVMNMKINGVNLDDYAIKYLHRQIYSGKNLYAALLIFFSKDKKTYRFSVKDKLLAAELLFSSNINQNDKVAVAEYIFINSDNLEDKLVVAKYLSQNLIK